MTGETGPAPRALEVEALRVRYPGRRRPALDGVDLVVAAGERVGITGRTGAGKSTLALAAAGFIPRVVRGRVEGAVRIEGRDAVGAAPADLLGRVGIVFATPANQLSASKLTVREELAFGLENLGLPRAEMDPRIDGILARLGIDHLAEREPFALSGGEQQRVAIASIVAMGTRVLVLDEPTAQLDPAGSVGVAELLAELAAEGVAIAIVEHDPSVLGRLDRIAVLDAAQVVATDLPGAALGTAVLEPLGLAAPTLVRLAEAAGLPASAAFDETVIIDGLRARLGAAPAGAPATEAAEGAIDGGAGAPGAKEAPAIDGVWRPVRDRPPVRLAVDGLVHRYPGGIEAVRGVSLVVEPGEAVAIVGQNGSGKTTLVKHLNGLLRPAAGRVEIDGRDAAAQAVHALAATVGFVFQNPDDQLFERSVEREVGFGPRNLGFDGGLAAALVEAALAAVGLDGERATNPYDLDLSNRKLVGLASVLAMDPAVLVLDEPTTGQDPAGVARVGAIVEAWVGAGRSVVAITHDMEFAARHFGRIVVMRGGEIVLDGPPGEVFAAERDELLASTGLTRPPAARVAAGLGLAAVPAGPGELLALLGLG